MQPSAPYPESNASGSGQLISIRVLNIDTPSLGDRSYLVHDGKTAVVIDPQRDIDRINELLLKRNLVLGAVVETHIHNDYVSGGLELTREHGAAYFINSDDPVTFKRSSVVNSEVIPVGTFALKAIHTPGHTFTHLSYALIDEQGNSIGVFTGGSLLHGSTGRPDLLGWYFARELAGLQYQSAKVLSEILEDGVEIYPTHGFGSFCSATPALTDSSTIADEVLTNPVFLLEQEPYIDVTLSALDRYPTYFKYMGPINTVGAQSLDLSKLEIKSESEILLAIHSGGWVVDLRNRKKWAKEHLLGSTSLGIDGSMASYLGWLYPYGEDLYLTSDNQADIDQAQRELARIGIDRPTGSFVGSLSLSKSTTSIKIASFAELAEAKKKSELTILDVRQVHERAKSHIKDSSFIPFYEVEARVSELPTKDEIWVHCASGYRAASVIGFIESSGRIPILIDDEYENAARIEGLSIISETGLA